jgi:hypothetical protein
MQWRRRGPSVCASWQCTCSLNVRLSGRGLSIEVKETERDDDAERTAQVADGSTLRGVAQLIGPCMMAEGLDTCLTDSVAGQFTVECLIDSVLVGRSEDPVLFHAGD